MSISNCKDSNILLSTTSALDGFVIVKYIKVISAEAIYKLSLGKAFSAMISNTVDSMRIFSDNELSGTSQLIQEAKDYVMEELIRKATALGANAVVGIDIESSISHDSIAKASINGTAVIIESVSPAVARKSLNFKAVVTNYNPDLCFRPVSLSFQTVDECTD